MTKNKKRKTAIREIAQAEGVGIARAALLNDREHSIPFVESAESAIREKERNLVGWTLESESDNDYSVPKISFYLDSDSPLNEVGQHVKDEFPYGNPHYIIEGGVRTNRYILMNYIWSLMSENPEVNASLLSEYDRARESEVASLVDLYKNRIEYMEENSLDTFSDYRRKYLLKQKEAPKYRYVFLYDWHATTRTASPELIDQIRFLIHEGKRVGIHFLVSTETSSIHVQGRKDYALMNEFTVGIPGKTYAGLASFLFRGSTHFMDIPDPILD